MLVYWPIARTRMFFAAGQASEEPVSSRDRPDVVIAELDSAGFWLCDAVGPEENDDVRYNSDGPTHWMDLPEDPDL